MLRLSNRRDLFASVSSRTPRVKISINVAGSIDGREERGNRSKLKQACGGIGNLTAGENNDGRCTVLLATRWIYVDLSCSCFAIDYRSHGAKSFHGPRRERIPRDQRQRKREREGREGKIDTSCRSFTRGGKER